jgi:hypothetical protein
MVKKIVLEKNFVIKLYKIIKIKGCEGSHCLPNIHCIMDYNDNPQCFFVFLEFFYGFFSNQFLLIFSFKINIVENLASWFMDLPK